MTDRKKPTAGSWMTVALVAALVAYPLSFGPACWLCGRTRSLAVVQGHRLAVRVSLADRAILEKNPLDKVLGGGRNAFAETGRLHSTSAESAKIRMNHIAACRNQKQIEPRMTRINADFPIDLVRVSSARIRVIRGSLDLPKNSRRADKSIDCS